MVPIWLVTKASKLQVYMQQGSAVLGDNDQILPLGWGTERSTPRGPWEMRRLWPVSNLLVLSRKWGESVRVKKGHGMLV